MKLTGEDEAAKALGADKEEIREIRISVLCQDRHFVIKPNKGIFYTEAGMDALVAAFYEAARDEKKTGAGAGAPVEAQEAVEEGPYSLRVVRLLPNPTWVFARRAVEGCKEMTGPEVQCRVRNNRRLRLGMVLAICERQADGRWRHLGC